MSGCWANGGARPDLMSGGLQSMSVSVRHLSCFAKCKNKGIKPDAFTNGSILNPCASAGALEWVKEVHWHVLYAGLESDLRVAVCMMHKWFLEGRHVISSTLMIGGLAEHECGLQTVASGRRCCRCVG